MISHWIHVKLNDFVSVRCLFSGWGSTMVEFQNEKLWVYSKKGVQKFYLSNIYGKYQLYTFAVDVMLVEFFSEKSSILASNLAHIAICFWLSLSFWFYKKISWKVLAIQILVFITAANTQNYYPYYLGYGGNNNYGGIGSSVSGRPSTYYNNYNWPYANSYAGSGGWNGITFPSNYYGNYYGNYAGGYNPWQFYWGYGDRK